MDYFMEWRPRYSILGTDMGTALEDNHIIKTHLFGLKTKEKNCFLFSCLVFEKRYKTLFTIKSNTESIGNQSEDNSGNDLSENQ